MADGTLIFKTALDTAGVSNGLQNVKKTAEAALGMSAKAITAVTGALTAGAGAGVLYNSSIENYTTSFEVMTGSAEKAVQVVDELKRVGASTPFELTNLADTTQLLMNYGFTADSAIDSMMMLGDIAQGDAEKLGRVAAAYGQMSSAGKVSLEDVKQMIEAGFNPLQEISESTGESMASLYERISKGRISVDEITDSMKRSTSEGGKYFQSMQKQSVTFSGQVSTMKDTAQMLLGQVVQPISDSMVNKLLPSAITSLEGLTEAFEKDGVQGLIKTAGPMIAGFVTEAAGYAPEMVSLALSLIDALVEGIADNLPKLISAGGEIAWSVIYGIGDMVPIAEPIIELLEYMADNMDVVCTSVVALTAAFVAYKAVFAINTLIQAYNKATKDMTIVQYAAKAAQDLLNSSFLACPVTWIVMALAAIAGAFIYLWNTSDSFRQFWINLWENVKASARNAWNSIEEFLCDSIPQFLKTAEEWIETLPERLAYWLGYALGSVISWGISLIEWVDTEMPLFIASIINYFQQLPSQIWNWLLEVLTKSADFAVKLLQKATEAGRGFYDNIVEALIGLPGKMVEIGSDIVAGIWKGISDGWDWLINKVKRLAEKLLEGAKDALGIHSPSTKFRYIGEMCVEGMDEPLRDYNPYGTLKASLAAGATGFVRGLNGGFLSSGTVNNYSQTYNIYQPVKSPSELMRAAKLEERFGMAG